MLFSLQHMFTGIIQELGTIKAVQETKSGKTIAIHAPKLSKALKNGDSLAVDGVCLTVTKKTKNKLFFDIIWETLSKSSFKFLKKNSKVNLELPLTLNDKISGHLVLGHIDGTAKVLKISQKGRGKEIEIEIPKKFEQYIAQKGCICVNGVSLTVAEKKKRSFMVAITPYTAKETNLEDLEKNSIINIETDLIARYLENLV